VRRSTKRALRRPWVPIGTPLRRISVRRCRVSRKRWVADWCAV
jgi:hypothetical protein